MPRLTLCDMPEEILTHMVALLFETKSPYSTLCRTFQWMILRCTCRAFSDKCRLIDYSSLTVNPTVLLYCTRPLNKVYDLKTGTIEHEPVSAFAEYRVPYAVRKQIPRHQDLEEIIFYYDFLKKNVVWKHLDFYVRSDPRYVGYLPKKHEERLLCHQSNTRKTRSQFVFVKDESRRDPKVNVVLRSMSTAIRTSNLKNLSLERIEGKGLKIIADCLPKSLQFLKVVDLMKRANSLRNLFRSLTKVCLMHLNLHHLGLLSSEETTSLLKYSTKQTTLCSLSLQSTFLNSGSFSYSFGCKSVAYHLMAVALGRSTALKNIHLDVDEPGFLAWFCQPAFADVTVRSSIPCVVHAIPQRHTCQLIHDESHCKYSLTTHGEEFLFRMLQRKETTFDHEQCHRQDYYQSTVNLYIVDEHETLRNPSEMGVLFFASFDDFADADPAHEDHPVPQAVPEAVPEPAPPMVLPAPVVPVSQGGLPPPDPEAKLRELYYFLTTLGAHPSWLSGWRVDFTQRADGKTKGRWDIYYFNASNERFRSKPEVARYYGLQLPEVG